MNMQKVKVNGIKWGPFRLRIPFVHIKFRTAEFLQGLIISGATAFAGIPIAMGMGLSFEEGVALSFISGTLIASGPIIFGVPFDYNKIIGVIGIIIFGLLFIRTEGSKDNVKA